MSVKVNWKELASYGVTDPRGKGQVILRAKVKCPSWQGSSDL